MWLLPVISGVSSAAARTFYRFDIVGPQPAPSGPLLLLANHPNSLLDPALVAAAAGRPVRFLAKSTLFDNRRVGWLVRAAGAIPVHRRSDDARAAERNVPMFEAVIEELGGGAAVGIFPEGISHSRPSLARLKTGAARMALGAYARNRSGPSLVPIGLVLRDKGVFRSEAIAVRGDAVSWSDLAGRLPSDSEAVRELTGRIEHALRRVTVNLERWEDRPLIECVEGIWSAEMGGVAESSDQLERARLAARILADLRRRGDREWVELAHEVTRHRRRLRVLGLAPTDLGARVDLVSGARWAARRLYLIVPPAVVLALTSAVAFWPAYRLTGRIVAAARPLPDERSTHKALIGAAVYAVWMLLVGVAVAWLWGALAGLATVVLLPVLGMAGLRIRERWRGSWNDVRRFFLFRTRRDLVEQLEADQRRLAGRLAAVYERWRAESTAPESPGEGIEVDVAAGQDDSDPSSGSVDPSAE